MMPADNHTHTGGDWDQLTATYGCSGEQHWLTLSPVGGGEILRVRATKLTRRGGRFTARAVTPDGRKMTLRGLDMKQSDRQANYWVVFV